ncbi:hypothetical protein [Dyella mobilis]|uniref:Uncharacterized protein n=1 Tax=Dyella mobilis TaxID=1849582 RepID=A0ABS2KBZ7_9GAMM|nr:hypothetical protein [Dyella mobilis]MBM7128624.1 hypothetical protein [Dyella mobilis]GLQ99471.1 hypothetical protein GCM10007863_38910 [Dyella mobilis]
MMLTELDCARVAQWLDAPRTSSQGGGFPVRVDYPSARSQENVEHYLARIVW